MTPVSLREVKNIAWKGSPPAEWQLVHWGEKLNRKMTVYLTWLLLHTPLTPDQITYLGTVVTLAGFVLFLWNDPVAHWIGVALVFFSFLIDGSDGEVARYRKAKGLAQNHFNLGGAYVEPMSHDIQYAFLFLPVGLGQAIATGSLVPLVAAFVATVSKLLFRLAECRLVTYEGEVTKERPASAAPPSIIKPKPRATASYFVYRHVFTSSMLVYPLAVSVAIRRVEWFLYFYAVGFGLLWIYKVLQQRGRIKKILSAS